MSKYKHKAVKDLSDTVKDHNKIDYNIQEKMKAEKALAMKVKIVDKVLRGPKHKVPERTAIFDPQTEELITDENEILATTLKYNIGVLTKNKVTEQDMPEVISKNELHEKIIKDTTKGEPLTVETYNTVLKLKHLKNTCPAT